MMLVALAVAAAGAVGAIAPLENDGAVQARLEGFRFIEGKQLERLRSGQSVAYDFSLQLFDGQRSLGRSLERFVVSYDLWEENFAVAVLSSTPGRPPKASVAHLKLAAVGDWCLNQIQVPFSSGDRGRDLTLLLEVRSVGSRLPNPLRPQGSVDLATLVEVFSRPAAAGEFRLVSRSQPFRLAERKQP